jgi:hypothetical protein
MLALPQDKYFQRATQDVRAGRFLRSLSCQAGIQRIFRELGIAPADDAAREHRNKPKLRKDTLKPRAVRRLAR